MLRKKLWSKLLKFADGEIGKCIIIVWSYFDKVFYVLYGQYVKNMPETFYELMDDRHFWLEGGHKVMKKVRAEAEAKRLRVKASKLLKDHY